MKPVFHSLGSNYSSGFVWLALKQLWSIWPNSTQQVQGLLESKYHGRVHLLYKGRDAIEFALRSYSIGEGDQVLTQAFTCYAIEEAIARAGATPVYVDLEKNQLNPSLRTLQLAYKNNPKIKAVLIQHTLGYPAEIQKIAQWCREKKLLLIEDLAQSLGAQDADGIEVGTYGDVIICSFGRDKVIDALSGGAVILRNDSPFFVKARDQEVLAEVIKKRVPAHIIKREMLYPLVTFLIRLTHQIGIGKVLFQVAKKANLLTSPIESPVPYMSPLPVQYAPLVLWQFQYLREQLNHRRKIAEIYKNRIYQQLDLPLETLSQKFAKDDLEQSVYLRFAVSVPEPVELAKKLLSEHIYLTDRWYRQPVDCGSLDLHSVYKEKSCKEAELRAATLFNLPTHRFITENTAQRITTAFIDALKSTT